jgi:hypothetical protein
MAPWKLVSKHDYEFLSALPVYARAIGFFVAGLAMTAGGVAILVFGTGGGSIAPYLLGGGITFFGLLTLTAAAFLWPWRHVRWVRVYEEGLRWKARGRVHKKRWDEVDTVSRSESQMVNPDGSRSEWGRMADLGLRFEDGTSVRFTTSLTDYDRLARYAQVTVAARQQAAAAAELDGAGKAFGLVHVARDGVTVDGRHFRWKELKRLHVYNGDLCADPSCRGWKPVPLAAIPNYVLMLSLVRGLGRLRE